MKKLLFLFALIICSVASWAQSKGYIVNDSTYFEKRGGNAELILENGTKDTVGFLYNKGGGRTTFKRALIKLNDTTYIIGADTLHTNRGIDGRNIFNSDGTLLGDRHVSMSHVHRLFLDSTFSFEILTANGPSGQIPAFRVGNNSGVNQVDLGDVDNLSNKTRLTVDDANIQVVIYTQGVFKFRGNSPTANPVDLKTQLGAPEYTLYFPTSENFFQLDTLARLKDLRDAVGAGFSDPLSTDGDIVARISGSTTRKAKGSNGTYLGVRSGTLDYYAPSDAELSTTNITTNNATTSKHGFLPILSNVATQYLDGTGAWSVPPSSSLAVSAAPNTANYTVPTGRRIFFTLADLTGQANHNVVLGATTAGDEIIITNLNTSASTFNWTFTGGTVKDFGQNTITTLTNLTVYHLVLISGSNYQIIN